MNFNEEIDKQLELLDANICCSYGTGEVFSVREPKPEGYAEVHLTVGSNPCFHVDKIDKNVFPVLACRRCADHLVFVFDPQTEEWTLHIFEMTRSISKTTWEEKILPQFNGGLTNAYAIMGVLRCCNGFYGSTGPLLLPKKQERDIPGTSETPAGRTGAAGLAERSGNLRIISAEDGTKPSAQAGWGWKRPTPTVTDIYY